MSDVSNTLCRAAAYVPDVGRCLLGRADRGRTMGEADSDWLVDVEPG